MMRRQSGISETNRHLLGTLHQKTAGPFSATEASSLLSMDLRRTRRFLAYLAARGWLARIRRGLYITVPLEATDPAEWREDPWIVAAKTFAPCYVGGWSACEHWGLTEQIFREVIVVTAQRVRHRRAEVQGTVFHIKVLPEQRIFGSRSVWRRQVRVQVSDPSRTLVDILDDPALGGGVRHVADVASAYFASEYRDDQRLLEYAERLGNRTVFKRLGYLVETLGVNAPDLVRACRQKQSFGLTMLDPTVHAKGRILKRWNLRINVEVAPAGGMP